MEALVVDDHYVFRAGLEPLLRELDDDVSVSYAGDFEEALSTLGSEKRFDLILLDLFLPDMDPFQGIRAIHKAAPSAPVVVISMSENRKDALQSIDAGATGFIPKTADAEEILKGLRFVLEGYIWVPQLLLAKNGTLDQTWERALGSVTVTEDPLEALTPRQRDVLRRVAAGRDNAEIARELGLSINTVKLHVSAILRTLRVSNRTEAARVVANRGEPWLEVRNGA